jgi:hypothetical protein
MKTKNIEEKILEIVFDNDPTHKSPYGLYGYPSMWEVGRKDGIIYTVRPHQTRDRVGVRWIEVPGYVLEKVNEQTGKLVDQAVEYPCDYDKHDPVLLTLINAYKN